MLFAPMHRSNGIRIRFASRFVRFAATSACVVALLACQKPLERYDWSSYDGPGARYVQREEYVLPFFEDPLEPVNRLTNGLNTGAHLLAIDPLATGWRYAVPQEARTAMINTSNNSEVIQYSVNNALQGDGEGASTSLKRFGVNTTVGVVGLEDEAAEQGLEPDRTDTGTTLNKAGWNKSAFLVEPLGGPSTIRDSVGGLGDLAMDPFLYFFPPAIVAKGFVRGNERAGDLTRFVTSNRDSYELSRRLYMARATVLEDAPSEPAADNSATQTLEYLNFAPSDPFFEYRATTGEAYIKMTREKLPYCAWIQEEKAPVAFVLPGYGGHRRNLQNIALAETLFNAGYSVATISSAANFEFMEQAGSVPFPGFGPQDARDVHASVDAVWRDLRVEHGNKVLERVLVGTSFGAYHTLFIAAQDNVDRGGHDLIDFDAYLAICPPIQLQHAAEQIDTYYNAFMEFPEEQRDPRAITALKKALRLVFSGFGPPPPFGDAEARFLVGLNFRLALHDVIWECREKREIPFLQTEWNLLTMASASQEVLDYSLMEYAYLLMLPYLRDEANLVEQEDDMFHQANLQRLGGRISGMDHVGIVTSENDFLLTDIDLEWIERTFPAQRRIVNKRGGHLGCLTDASVREAAIGLLRSMQEGSDALARR